MEVVEPRELRNEFLEALNKARERNKKSGNKYADRVDYAEGI